MDKRTRLHAKAQGGVSSVFWDTKYGAAACGFISSQEEAQILLNSGGIVMRPHPDAPQVVQFKVRRDREYSRISALGSPSREGSETRRCWRFPPPWPLSACIGRLRTTRRTQGFAIHHRPKADQSLSEEFAARAHVREAVFPLAA
jgi:hypothetical protein